MPAFTHAMAAPANDSVSEIFNVTGWEGCLFHKLSNVEAYEILYNKKPGTYLVWPSPTRPGSFVLSVADYIKVNHYVVYHDGSLWRLLEQTYGGMNSNRGFTKTVDLIAFYGKENLPYSTTMLTKPVSSEEELALRRGKNPPKVVLVDDGYPPLVSDLLRHGHHFVRMRNDFESFKVDFLPYKKNEVLEVLYQRNDAWWTVRNTYGAVGQAPGPFEQVNDDL